MAKRAGLSLIELLVTTGIVSLLSLLLLEFFLSSRKVTEHGAAHTALQQSCRHLLNRLSTLVVSACAPNDTQDGIPRPALGDGPANELWFYSPDDLFGNAAFDPRNPTFHFYRVVRDGPKVMLEKLQDDGTPMVTPPPRQLALTVDQLEFERPQLGLVRVRVSARGQVRGARREIPLSTELQTTLSVPYYTSQ